MSQGALVTIISLALYLSNLLGGGSSLPATSRSNTPAPAYSTPAPVASSGVITGNTVVVYDAIGSRNRVAELHRGEYVDLLQREGSWYKVRLADGATGYVTAFTLMPADPGQGVSIPRGPGQPTILGYYVTDKRLPSLPSLQAHSDVLTAISPWTWEVTQSGDLVASFDTKDAGASLKYAGDRGLKTYALIHNFALDDKGKQTFNSNLAHKMLSNPAARSRLVQNIGRTLRDWRMTGVHIDFEMVRPADRSYLSAFMSELYAALHPAGFEVTMAVPSKTQESLTSSWAGAYDYAALGRATDQMMLMTYDEHWSGGQPGPVASADWVESVARYAISAGVPAKKIVLGVAGYGYDWPRSGTGRAVTYSSAMRIASDNGAQIHWDAKAKVPYFRYGNGRQVWFENRQSLSYKLAIVNKLNLAGISIWRLGQEDPGFWPVIRDMLA